MNVLSLFDGMSCGMIALEKSGFSVDNYFASEIDPYAIKVSKANYPQIKHIGSVTDVKAENLPQIDLLIGGSPCQGFSFAGKQLNFEDPRSKLFFEYVRLLKECKPKYFLLENVVMKKEFQDVITNEMGVEPILINSALVSAQIRKRLYWTNIPGVKQPEDRKITLQSILNTGFVEKEKSWCMLESWNRFCKKTDSAKARYKKAMMPIVFLDSSFSWDNWRPLDRRECERLQTVPEGYTDILKENIAMGIMGNGWTVDVIAYIFNNMEF